MPAKQQPNVFVTIIIKASIYVLLPIGGGLKVWDLIQQNKEYEADKHKMEVSEQDFQREKARLERENANIQTELASMENERDQLLRELQEKAQVISSDKQQIASLENEMSEKESTVDALTRRLNDSQEDGWKIQQQIKNELAVAQSQKDAVEESLVALRQDSETRKSEYGNFVNERRNSLGVLAGQFEQIEMMSIQEVQTLFARQQSEFQKDLKMLMEAFESEMNTLIDRRGRRIPEREIRESLERIRAIYEGLRDKYQSPVFDVKINSIKQQIQYT